MMSPESSADQDVLGVLYPAAGDHSPPRSAKRIRFASVGDEDVSLGSNGTDTNGSTLADGGPKRGCAKDSRRQRAYSITESEDGDGDCGRVGGPAASSLDYTAGSDRSSGSSCTTVIYGAGAGGDGGLVGSKCTDSLFGNKSKSPIGASNHNHNHNNNNNNSNKNNNNTGIGGGGGEIGAVLNNNNHSSKGRLGEMDEAKFSEFSKFLADSEKDESMTTILELLHDNYGLIQRYASGYECKQDKCQYESLHEHFHCHDTYCRGKVLYKKYEIIRHLKWHKKRKESLKYGFFRFSSSDDCSIQYGACQHNHKHTHYHCVHENCDKVYISTSDVQMHANYHRKHEAIVKNGFQRFRATEECNTEHCAFRAQRTTHFHCRRENCKYTFKNKADMEKHKTYHQKDEMLLRDGYKKFLKSEDCTYKDCRFSRVCNHIHCMHENCHYVLHSSGQLLSHKRKHERMDTEVDYRRFQMARSLLTKINQPKADEAGPAGVEVESAPEQVAGEEEPRLSPAPTGPESSAVGSSAKNPFLDLLAVMAEITFRTLPIQMMYHMRLQLLQHMGYEQVFAPANVEMLRSFTMMGGIEESYLSQLYGGSMGSSPTSLQDQATGQITGPTGLGHEKPPPAKRKCKPNEPTDHLESPGELPLYAKKEPLSSTPPRSKFISNPSVDYRLLKREDATGPAGQSTATTPTSSKGSTLEAGGASVSDQRDHRTLLETANFLQFSSSKTLFNRKRGRPRKNHVMEVYNNVQDSPQAIFTSFKLEKSDSKPSTDVHPVTVPPRDAPAAMCANETERNGVTESFGRSEAGSDGRHERLPAGQPYLGGGYMAPMGVGGVTPLTAGQLDSAALFGNFSQLLERHMREVKNEPTLAQDGVERQEKSRNHLKCVVCRNLFETFADIKNHECHGDRAALDKPLLAFPPPMVRHGAPPGVCDYRTAPFTTGHDPEPSGAVCRGGVPLLAAPNTTTVPSHSSQPKDSVSLVKTAGTFFPDVNANKLKYA